jgi:hypothetical protein
MDLLLLILIVLAVISISGWGYGTYGYRAVPAGDVVAAPAPGWASPLGILGVLLLVGLLMMLFTGWRPFVVAP